MWRRAFTHNLLLKIDSVCIYPPRRPPHRVRCSWGGCDVVLVNRLCPGTVLTKFSTALEEASVWKRSAHIVWFVSHSRRRLMGAMTAGPDSYLLTLTVPHSSQLCLSSLSSVARRRIATRHTKSQRRRTDDDQFKYQEKAELQKRHHLLFYN